MRYTEASNIIDKIWDEWSKADKAELLKTCVKYFFSKSLIKPCPLLSGNDCRVYESRPLNCRLYGLWPKDVWERRVDMFQKSTGLPREQLPLNTQCELVKRKPLVCDKCNGDKKVTVDSVEFPCENCKGTGRIIQPALTEAQIQGIYDELDKLDMSVGNLSKEQIEQSWNIRTLHDWILYKVFGEDLLSRMTTLATSSGASDETIEAIIKIMSDQVDELVK